MPSDSFTSGGRGRNTKELKVIVAIDFGTTYSGIAYANTHEPDKQVVLTNWGRGTLSNHKAPTILRYDNGGTTGPFKWGFQARKNLRPGEKIHEWFKLGLCPEYEQRRAEESELGRKYPSTTALSPVSVEKAEKLAIDYLSSLEKCIDNHLNGLDARVKELPREYIITVPAIWDHKEQDRARRCAQRAGLGEGNQLRIISEPEAAAIYALDRMPKIGLKVDDTFVICDAGGGTVDLTSYTIQSLDPIALRGAVKGSGGLCGSSFLNRIFAKYLDDKLRGYPGNWDYGWLNHAMEEFERRIKPEFTGDDDEQYTIMVHGLQDSRHHGISAGSLELSGKELRKHVFDEVITKIQGLVADQIANTPKPVKAVLLAGGFGRSTYLKHRLERIPVVKGQKIRIQHIENSDTAIVRGALIAGLTRHGKDQDGTLRVCGPRVDSRVAPKSYGTRAFQPFNPIEDNPERKKHQPSGEYLVERMQWFIIEGKQVPDEVPKTFKFEKDKEVNAGRIEEVKIHIYSSEKRDSGGVAKPNYPDDAGVRECANFTMDLRDVDIPIKTRNGMPLYVAEIYIEVTLESASLSFCGVYAKGTNKEKRFEPQYVQFV